MDSLGTWQLRKQKPDLLALHMVLRSQQFPMRVAMIFARIMQMPCHQVIIVIGMRNALVTAVRPMLVIGVMPFALMIRRAGAGIHR